MSRAWLRRQASRCPIRTMEHKDTGSEEKSSGGRWGEEGEIGRDWKVYGLSELKRAMCVKYTTDSKNARKMS